MDVFGDKGLKSLCLHVASAFNSVRNSTVGILKMPISKKDFFFNFRISTISQGYFSCYTVPDFRNSLCRTETLGNLKKRLRSSQMPYSPDLTLGFSLFLKL